MAHFAQIGRNNKVLRVLKIENADMLDSNNVEQESIGQNFLAESHGIFPEWVQCSINTFENVHALGGVPLRANFPGVGWYYDETNNVFHMGRPTDKDGQSCTSWTMNKYTGVWSAPITKPTSGVTETSWYVWDESAYQADNTTGWVKSDA